MFGMLHPCLSSLQPAERERYQRYYCGLCQSVGEDYGLWQRALQSSDAVFLSLLADSLVADSASASAGRTRCPVMPLRHRETLQGGALQCASAVQVHLVDQRLADHEAEGQWLGAARPVMSRSAARAWEVLASLGMELRAHEALAETQLDVEADCSDPAQAAAPTAAALSDAFGDLANLPGAEHITQAHREALARLGGALGRTIYLIDALEDLEEDLRGGAFNPCIQRAGEAGWVDPDAIARCEALLTADAERLEADLLSLPLARNERLIHHILLERLPARRGSAMAAASEMSARSLPAPWPVWRRGAYAFSAWCVVIWIWLTSLPTALAGDAMPMASNQCGGSPCEKACCGCVATICGFQ